METTPLSQEEKIKEFISQLRFKFRFNASTSIEDIVRESIQFGSLLTIERAKEKVEKELLFPDDCLLFKGEPFVDREKVLKAIESTSVSKIEAVFLAVSDFCIQHNK